MTDPAPTPSSTLPWHGIGIACAGAAAGIVAYVGITGAQLFGMVSATPDTLAVADPPLLATPSVAPATAPTPRAPKTHAPTPVEKAEPSRSERRSPRPTPSPTATPTQAAAKAPAPTKTAAAPRTTRRQQTLEVKHATWADRQLASMLRTTSSPMSWFAGSFVLPTSNYHLTARFGETSYLWSSTHTGLDFAAATGTPVRAVTAGTVTSVGWGGAYGNRIEITHPDGTQTWYCHLSKTYVSTGAQVATGAVIGAVGATGNVTGPHLHLEVRPNGGSPVDPYAYLQQHGLHP